MNLLDALKWRYATKKMTPDRVVPQEKIENILEAVRLAPSSSGLQPYEIIVVSNKDIREKIKAIAWNQPQITECSHVLVFAAWDDYTPDRINAAFDYSIRERGGTNEGYETYRQNLLTNYPPRGSEVNFQHSAKQAYIALGVALVAAANEEVDSTPMEGFDPKALDEILGLGARGLRSVVIMPLGYRDATGDWLVNLKKVRRPLEQFVSQVK